MFDILVKLAAHAAITSFFTVLTFSFISLLRELTDGKDAENIKEMLAFGATVFATIFLAIATLISASGVLVLVFTYTRSLV